MLARFGEAIDHQDPIARVSELARLRVPSRLRDYRVPKQDLPELAHGIAPRPGANANPRPAPPDVRIFTPRRPRRRDLTTQT